MFYTLVADLPDCHPEYDTIEDFLNDDDFNRELENLSALEYFTDNDGNLLSPDKHLVLRYENGTR